MSVRHLVAMSCFIICRSSA